MSQIYKNGGGGGGGGITTIDGDVGSVTGSTIDLYANTSGASCGSSVFFKAASATQMDLEVTDSNSNTIIGFAAGNSSISGTANSGVGESSLHDLTSGSGNSCFGYGQMITATSASYNSCLGNDVFRSLLTGEFNIAIGYTSGSNYTSSESSNVLINSAGVASESNTIRIGIQGSSSGEQNACYIAGITGVTVSNEELVTINSSTGQLGVTAVPSAGFSSINIQTFTTSGTYTPTSGMLYCIIECVGGGGGGGGCISTVGTYAYGGGGGGAGSYSKKIASAAQIGASQTVTIGSGGSGGAAGAHDGSAGSDTSVGVLCVGKGGSGGQYCNDSQTHTGLGGAGGVAGTGDFTPTGATGGNMPYFINYEATGSYSTGGIGASSIYGGGGISPYAVYVAETGFIGNNGNNATNYGSGGSGGCIAFCDTSYSGGNGSAGVVVITEYI